MNKKVGDILVIADTQIDGNSPTEHLVALSKYIWKHKPTHVIHIGDHWDFPSLSTYASMMEKEGRRLSDDINAGREAFDLIMAETNKQNATRVKQYTPELHFIEGNHENRLKRYLSGRPELAGLVDIGGLVEAKGWTYHNFLEPLWVEGICFIHYLSNAQSGRAVGGSIENKLNKFPHSFVHGHQQQFQFGRRQNLLGMSHFGICAGSFYMHDEDYRGCNNTEIRGFVHLKKFENRYNAVDFDIEYVSLERLLGQY